MVGFYIRLKGPKTMAVEERKSLWDLRCFLGHVLHTTTASNINGMCNPCSPKSLNGLNVQGVFRSDYCVLPSSLTSHKVLRGSPLTFQRQWSLLSLLGLGRAVLSTVHVQLASGLSGVGR